MEVFFIKFCQERRQLGFPFFCGDILPTSTPAPDVLESRRRARALQEFPKELCLHLRPTRHQLTPNIPWPRVGPSIWGRLISIYIHVCTLYMPEWYGNGTLYCHQHIRYKNTTITCKWWASKIALLAIYKHCFWPQKNEGNKETDIVIAPLRTWVPSNVYAAFVCATDVL